ncbi:MAG: iron-containing alcohol dehydrogenase [Candidatus Lokiarchaeota archaeon]|nr:iron-containing alcohol dehydrogenase [Candidatus Lokiarchaeota archaeon]
MPREETAWYENEGVKNLFIKASSNAMRGYHCIIAAPKLTFTGTNSLIDFINYMGVYLANDERRVLIVVDKDLRKKAEMVADHLHTMKQIECRVFDNVLPDAPKPTVMEGVALCNEFHPRVIIGIGGGSALDTMKMIFVLYEMPSIDLNAVMAASWLGLRKKVKAIAAMPTTSGTGSETTFIAVMTDTDRNPPRKTAVVCYELAPDFAVLNPDFVKTMPTGLALGTGFDALAHAAGSYILTMSHDFTDMANLKAIEMILKWLPRSVKYPDDMEAREKMQMAAFIAGVGFGNVSGGIEHGIGHSLGGLFHVHHGVCVGIYLPAAIAFQAKVTNRFIPLAKEFGVLVDGKTRDGILKELLVALLQFMADTGFPVGINALTKPAISKKEYLEKMDILVELSENDFTTLSAARWVDRNQYRRMALAAYENKIDDLMELYHT